MVDIGTDINGEWELTENGDLRLISQEDNMVQSITNRLSCTLNNLKVYYNEYGSLLFGFIVWKQNYTTLEFMKIEIGNRLMQDPRISGYTISLDYNGNGEVDIDLQIKLTSGKDLDMSLLLDNESNVQVR